MTFNITGPTTAYQASVQPVSGIYTNWVTVTKAGSTNQAITVTVTPNNMPVSNYLAMVTVTFGGKYPTVMVPVTVAITSFRDNAHLTAAGFGFTSQQSFDFTQGPIPPNCEIGTAMAACSAGIDDLTGSSPYALSAITVDGGSWITLSGTSRGCSGGTCLGTTPDNAIFTIDPNQLPLGQGVATGYVVVDGGTRGMDYLIVTMPAIQPSAYGNALTALVAAVPPRSMAMSYVDGGNGSLTSMHLVNIGNLVSSYTLNFWTTDPNSGNVIPMAVPLADGTKPFSLKGTVQPGGMTVINTSTTAEPEAVGWGELITTGNIQGYALLTQSGQQSPSVEATTELGLSNRRFTLPFDNTNGAATEMFLVNPGSVTAGVTLSLADTTGAAIPNTAFNFPLGAGNQTNFQVTDIYPQSPALGLLNISANSVVSASALRFDATGGMSNSPAFSIPPTGSDSVLPVFAYGGGWTTTFSGISLGTSESLTWRFAQSGTSYSAPGATLDAGIVGLPGSSAVTQTVAAEGLDVLQTTSSSPFTGVGWVAATEGVINSGPLTSAFGLLDAAGYVSTFSTCVPLASSFQDRGIYPFDNTGQMNTLLFVTNADSIGSALFKLEVRDESGNPAPVQVYDNYGNLLNLPATFSLGAHVQTAFQLAGGARGTVQVTAVGHVQYGLLFRFMSNGMFTTLPGYQGPTGK
jgi:hypothetical protein